MRVSVAQLTVTCFYDNFKFVIRINHSGTRNRYKTYYRHTVTHYTGIIAVVVRQSQRARTHCVRLCAIQADTRRRVSRVRSAIIHRSFHRDDDKRTRGKSGCGSEGGQGEGNQGEGGNGPCGVVLVYKSSLGRNYFGGDTSTHTHTLQPEWVLKSGVDGSMGRTRNIITSVSFYGGKKTYQVYYGTPFKTLLLGLLCDIYFFGISFGQYSRRPETRLPAARIQRKRLIIRETRKTHLRRLALLAALCFPLLFFFSLEHNRAPVSFVRFVLFIHGGFLRRLKIPHKVTKITNGYYDH